MDLTNRRRRAGDLADPSPKKLESTLHPPSGLWEPSLLSELYYGPDSVKKHLLSCLPSKDSKAFIITGNSLANNTPLIRTVEDLLTPTHHAGTFSQIRQHAPIAQLDEASSLISADKQIDTLISIGGGSPIDSAKAISHRHASQHDNNFLQHITIPTTLSAAECSSIAGYTDKSGLKVTINHPSCQPTIIIYDALFAKHTPATLFLSTGIRALDHALELLYHPTASETPTKPSALSAASSLFRLLPRYKSTTALDPANAGTTPQDLEVITNLQLAAFASLGLLGLNLKGGLGLSHTLGYALGSPYGIPHGVTSCITLSHVLALKADTSPDAAEQLARALPFIGITGDPEPDSLPTDAEGDEDAYNKFKARYQAHLVSDAVGRLVRELGLETTLTEKGVGREEVGVIAERATGEKEGGMFDRVKALVERLY